MTGFTRKVSPTCARHGLFFTTGQKPGSDRNRRMRTRTYGGVAAGAGLLGQSPASRFRRKAPGHGTGRSQRRDEGFLEGALSRHLLHGDVGRQPRQLFEADE